MKTPKFKKHDVFPIDHARSPILIHYKGKYYDFQCTTKSIKVKNYKSAQAHHFDVCVPDDANKLNGKIFVGILEVLEGFLHFMGIMKR